MGIDSGAPEIIDRFIGQREEPLLHCDPAVGCGSLKKVVFEIFWLATDIVMVDHLRIGSSLIHTAQFKKIFRLTLANLK